MKEKEIEREGDRQFQKVSLPTLLHEASVVDKTRKRGGTSDCKKSACKQDRILEVQQRRGVPSRKHTDGHDDIGSDVAPARRFFKVH